MRLETRPSELSTPEHPRFLWFAWQAGQCVARGTVRDPALVTEAMRQELARISIDRSQQEMATWADRAEEVFGALEHSELSPWQ